MMSKGGNTSLQYFTKREKKEEEEEEVSQSIERLDFLIYQRKRNIQKLEQKSTLEPPPPLTQEQQRVE